VETRKLSQKISFQDFSHSFAKATFFALLFHLLSYTPLYTLMHKKLFTYKSQRKKNLQLCLILSCKTKIEHETSFCTKIFCPLLFQVVNLGPLLHKLSLVPSKLGVFIPKSKTLWITLISSLFFGEVLGERAFAMELHIYFLKISTNKPPFAR